SASPASRLFLERKGSTVGGNLLFVRGVRARRRVGKARRRQEILLWKRSRLPASVAVVTFQSRYRAVGGRLSVDFEWARGGILDLSAAELVRIVAAPTAQ